VRVKTPTGILVEYVDVLLEISDKFHAMLGPLFGQAERVDLETDPHQPEIIPEPLAHEDDFRVRIRPSEAERFHADLMELQVAAPLRPLVTEHRSDVPQPLRAV